MTQYQESVIREIMRKLYLTPIEKTFKYFDSNSAYEISFEWDAAGISNSGLIVLIEIESGKVSDWHIQTHLCRLAVMIDRGTKVEKLIWIIDQGVFCFLKNQVDSWLSFFRTVCRVSLPDMEYRTPRGELLR